MNLTGTVTLLRPLRRKGKNQLSFTHHYILRALDAYVGDNRCFIVIVELTNNVILGY